MYVRAYVLRAWSPGVTLLNIIAVGLHAKRRGDRIHHMMLSCALAFRCDDKPHLRFLHTAGKKQKQGFALIFSQVSRGRVGSGELKKNLRVNSRAGSQEVRSKCHGSGPWVGSCEKEVFE